jgi:large subunit ribosomal protein L17e
MTSTKYCYNPTHSKHAKAKAERVRVHFKNTVQVANAIRGMSLFRAKRYLNNVLRHIEAVPFKGPFNGGPGRHAQAKNWKVSQCRWPTKSVRAMLEILRNAEANAKNRSLTRSKLYIAHVHVNKAALIRRRTFRAHGRINAYMCTPSHIELVLEERQTTTKAPKQVPALEATQQ